MIEIPKGKWTWGEIKRYLEKGGVNNDTPVFYIDIDKDSKHHITFHLGDQGAEITNYPNM